MKKFFLYFLFPVLAIQCTSVPHRPKLQPVVITEAVNFDTDDPAIWINAADPSQSLIIGTDKEMRGGLFVFDLNGKIVNKVAGINRPNNVDVEYGFNIQGKKTDIVAVTERKKNRVNIYAVPSMNQIGSFEVFDGESLRDPMGISLYKNPQNHEVYAIVGRKTGPTGTYLWQYQLTESGGKVSGTVVRKFGHFSGKKEIESIAVDDELGYIYYSDEKHGIHKYFADPAKGNAELALFGMRDFKEDIEGISIYKNSEGTGYILVSNQQSDTFNIYPREGSDGIMHLHHRIAEIPVSTLESDGSEVTNVNLGPKFPKGIFVAMSNGKNFHYYDWRDIQQRIDEQHNEKK